MNWKKRTMLVADVELILRDSLSLWPWWKFYNCHNLGIHNTLLLSRLPHLWFWQVQFDRMRQNLQSWLTVQRMPLSNVVTHVSLHLSAPDDGKNMVVTSLVRKLITAVRFSAKTKVFPCCAKKHFSTMQWGPHTECFYYLLFPVV